MMKDSESVLVTLRFRKMIKQKKKSRMQFISRSEKKLKFPASLSGGSMNRMIEVVSQTLWCRNEPRLLVPPKRMRLILQVNLFESFLRLNKD